MDAALAQARRLGFIQARDALSPAGREIAPPGPFDRSAFSYGCTPWRPKWRRSCPRCPDAACSKRDGRAVEPPTVDQTALAEIGKGSQRPGGNERLIQLGELKHDPIRYPIQVLSVHLDALYKLSVERSRAVASLTEASRNPISDERRSAVWPTLPSKGRIAIGVVAALAATTVGFVAG